MLKQLLVLLETRDTWNTTELASALGTSPDLVDAMLEHLAQSGKIGILDQSCAGECAGCSLAGACQTQSTNRMFVYASHEHKPSSAGRKRHENSPA
jgi:hypothetical protein